MKLSKAEITERLVGLEECVFNQQRQIEGLSDKTKINNFQDKIETLLPQTGMTNYVPQDTENLSGNDIVKTLLERKELVIVKVSDISYEHAREQNYFFIAVWYNEDKCVAVIQDGWECDFVVPYDKYENEITEI